MQRRIFSREFKLEAVNLIKERGVPVVQASRDLDVAESVLRRWVRDLTENPNRHFRVMVRELLSSRRLTGFGGRSPS